MEEEDQNGYAVNWVNVACVDPTAYVSVYFTGVVSNFSSQFYAVLSSANCGHYLVGIGYMPNPNFEVEGEAESDMFQAGVCASYNQESFGATVTGSQNVNTDVSASFDGKTWHQAYNWGRTVNYPYNLQYWAGDYAWAVFGQ